MFGATFSQLAGLGCLIISIAWAFVMVYNAVRDDKEHKP